jgi:hypothetical protein
MSDLILISDPPEYVQQVLFPSIGGAQCSGNACQFPFARKLYGQNVGFMFLGAAVLFLIGYIQLSLISFPGARVLRAKHKLCWWWRCSKTGHDLEQSGAATLNEEAVLEEVTAESEFVASIIQPLLKPRDPSAVERGEDESGDVVLADAESIPRNTLPPVVTFKLGKVYPAVGGLPPKIALSSLDLHVPKGEVLGLLGQNGAGKTTGTFLCSLLVVDNEGKGEPNHFIRDVSHMVHGRKRLVFVVVVASICLLGYTDEQLSRFFPLHMKVLLGSACWRVTM